MDAPQRSGLAMLLTEGTSQLSHTHPANSQKPVVKEIQEPAFLSLFPIWLVIFVSSYNRHDLYKQHLPLLVYILRKRKPGFKLDLWLIKYIIWDKSLVNSLGLSFLFCEVNMLYHLIQGLLQLISKSSDNQSTCAFPQILRYVFRAF